MAFLEVFSDQFESSPAGTNLTAHTPDTAGNGYVSELGGNITIHSPDTTLGQHARGASGVHIYQLIGAFNDDQEASYVIASKGATNTVRVLVRASMATDVSGYGVDISSGNKVRVLRLDDGVTTVIGESAVEAFSDGLITMTIRAEGDVITAIASDGVVTLQATATDTTYRTGAPRLRIFGFKWIDNLVLSTQAAGGGRDDLVGVGLTAGYRLNTPAAGQVVRAPVPLAQRHFFAWAASSNPPLSVRGLVVSYRLSKPAVGQVHRLTGAGVQFGMRVSRPLSAGRNDLSSAGIAFGYRLSTPSVGEIVTNHLTGVGIAVAYRLSTPAVGQIHALTGVGIAAAYRLSTPAVKQIHALTGAGITTAYRLSTPAVDAFFPAEHYEPVRLLATAPDGAVSAQVVVIADANVDGLLRLDNFRSDVAVRDSDVDILGTTNAEIILGSIDANSNSIISLASTVTLQGGQLTSLSQADIRTQARISGLESGVSGLADTQVQIQSQVTSQGDSITANSVAITSLQNTVSNQGSDLTATANALDSLKTTVTSQGDSITALSSAQTSTQAQVTDLGGTVSNQVLTLISQQSAITVIDGRVETVESNIGLRIDQDGRVIGRIDLSGSNGTSNLDFMADTIRFFDGTSAKPIMQVTEGQLEICGDLVATGSIRANAITLTEQRDSTSAISLVSGGFETWTSVPGLSATVASDIGDVIEVSTTLTPWANNAGGSAWLIAARLLRNGTPVANSGVLMEWDSIASGSLSIATPFQARYNGTGGNDLLQVQVRVSAASSGKASMPPALEIRRGRMEVRRLRR
ncbi:hypothetical protein JCM17845_15580 [Iodidimonas gelatinilytica]|uniref:Uncharacterized protein n=1 Tax=Iodidimonas gelatinilytica TaxID=1236966 RepID=A0A5A7MZS0_9PROT|nr:hypothetical protein [Iodidimonas gelatinilytica]GER00935.1 hypothetical protein JCM17845_15580 [Iodidimonas gelatinilytica]